tara:strand:+ start:431 stop:844 length:414 start_codon:yes stop_codon:yes gene_type:complete
MMKMTEADKIGVDKLVSLYLKIRDKKVELTTTFRTKEEELNTKLDAVKTTLLDHCKNTGIESVRTVSGTFYRTVRNKYWTSDWVSMNNFIIEHKAVDLLEKRIHQSNMKQFLEENPEVLPPGLNVDAEYTITVRRKK